MPKVRTFLNIFILVVSLTIEERVTARDRSKNEDDIPNLHVP